MEELNKKIAEWVGFKSPRIQDNTGPLGKPIPSTIWGVQGGITSCLGGLFTESLDACFKYIVPNRISEVTFMYASNCVSCDIEDLESNFFEGHVNTDSIEEAWGKAAEAFCQAVEKLIDGAH